MPRFAEFDASALRRASTVGRLPWVSQTVVLIQVTASGVVNVAATPPQKQRMLDDTDRRDLVLVAWPHQWGQEILVVDDLKHAKTAVETQ